MKRLIVAIFIAKSLLIAEPSNAEPPRLVSSYEDFRLHMQLHVQRVALIAEYLVWNFPEFAALRGHSSLVREFSLRHDLAKITDAGLERIPQENLDRHNISQPHVTNHSEQILQRLYQYFGSVSGMSAEGKNRFFEFVDQVVNEADDLVEKEFLRERGLEGSYLGKLLHVVVDAADKIDRSMSPASAEEFGVARMVPAHEYIQAHQARRVTFDLIPQNRLIEIMEQTERAYEEIVVGLTMEAAKYGRLSQRHPAAALALAGCPFAFQVPVR